MLTVIFDIQDRLNNGQTGNASHTEFAQGSVCKVYVKFSDERAGLRAIRSSYLGRKSYSFPIEKCEPKIAIKKGSSSPSIKRKQFPLILAWASTVHQVQGLSLEQRVIDFDLRKQKTFGPTEIYTVPSRVKMYGNLYCIGKF